jgi:hypothetical protein
MKPIEDIGKGPCLEQGRKHNTITLLLFGASIDDCTAKIQEKYKQLEGCLQEFFIGRSTFQIPLNTLQLIHGNFEAISLHHGQYLYTCYRVASSDETSSSTKFFRNSQKMPSNYALCGKCHGEQLADYKSEECKRNTEEQSINWVRLCYMCLDGVKKYALWL